MALSLGKTTFNELYYDEILQRDALTLKVKTTSGNPTFTSTSSGATYTCTANGGEVELLQLINNATAVANSSLNIDDITAIETEVNNKVGLTGNETVADIKTFSSSPVVPTATLSTQATNKGQVDTALGGKEDTINLTINRAVVSDGAGGLGVATTTATEIGYVNGVTSGIQAQLNAKLSSVPDASEITKGIAQIATTAEAIAATDDTKIITPVKVISAVPSASDTVAGKIELATTSEVITGTDSTRAVTPAGLHDAFVNDYCYLRRSSDQTSGTSVLWNSEVSDVNGMHNNTTNQQRITIVNSGTYLINFTGMRYAASNSVRCYLYKNGVNNGTGSVFLGTDFIADGNLVTSNINIILQLNSGDYIHIQYFESLTATRQLLSDYSEIVVQRII